MRKRMLCCHATFERLLMMMMPPARATARAFFRAPRCYGAQRRHERMRAGERVCFMFSISFRYVCTLFRATFRLRYYARSGVQLLLLTSSSSSLPLPLSVGVFPYVVYSG